MNTYLYNAKHTLTQQEYYGVVSVDNPFELIEELKTHFKETFDSLLITNIVNIEEVEEQHD